MAKTRSYFHYQPPLKPVGGLNGHPNNNPTLIVMERNGSDGHIVRPKASKHSPNTCPMKICPYITTETFVGYITSPPQGNIYDKKYPTCGKISREVGVKMAWRNANCPRGVWHSWDSGISVGFFKILIGFWSIPRAPFPHNASKIQYIRPYNSRLI